MRNWKLWVLNTSQENGFTGNKKGADRNRASYREENMLYEMKNMLTSETIYFRHFLSCLRFSKMNPCPYIVENMKTGRKYWITGINAKTYKLEVYNGITA